MQEAGARGCWFQNVFTPEFLNFASALMNNEERTPRL